MIELNIYPKNKEHFIKLLEFCEAVIDVCTELGIEPVLNASLAVLAYTSDQSMYVNDIDLSCSESEFPKLSRALEARGIRTLITYWHVLQALKYGLKIEFDSKEYWMKDLSGDNETMVIGNLKLKVVSLSDLIELYRRGLEDTANKEDDVNKNKHNDISKKYETLMAISK